MDLEWKREKEELVWKHLKKQFYFYVSPVLEGTIKEKVELILKRETFSWMGSENQEMNPHYYKYQAEARDEQRGQDYFVKIHEKTLNGLSRNLIKNLEQEVKRQKKATFTSAYLAKLYAVEEDERYIYFIYEKAQGMSLEALMQNEKFIGLAKEEQTRLIFSIFYQILLGIRGYMYDEKGKINVHRDLTSWNIFANLIINDSGKNEIQIKIIDFGQMHIGICSEEWPMQVVSQTEMLEIIPFSPQYVRYDYTDYYRIDTGRRESDDPGLDFYSAAMILIRLLEGKPYFTIKEAKNPQLRKKELEQTALDRSKLFLLCSPEYRKLLILLDQMTRKMKTLTIKEILDKYYCFLQDYYQKENIFAILSLAELLASQKKVRSSKEVFIRYALCGGQSDGTLEQISLQEGAGLIIDPANHDGCCFILDSRYTKGLIHNGFYLYVWREKVKILPLSDEVKVNGETPFLGRVMTIKEKDVLEFGTFSIIIKAIRLIVGK